MNLSRALRYTLAIGLLIAAGTSAQARQTFPAVGGAGKHADPAQCEPDEYLVGFEGHVGLWIDRIRPLCAKISSDGRRGEINAEQSAFGGSGGSPAEFSCPADSIVYSITPAITPNQELGSVTFNCYRPLDGQYLPDQLRFGGTRASAGQASQSCPSGEVGSGIMLRYGQYVNAIGLICDELVIPKASASSKPAKPTTGSVAVTTLSFAGAWKTTTSSNGHFTLALTPILVDQQPIPGRPIPFTGTFVNADGAHDYDGQIQGSAVFPTTVLNFTYTQPGIGAGGSGTFMLSNDGKSFTGSGLHNGTDEYAWNGARNKSPAAPAAPAGANGGVDDNTPMGTGGKNTDGDMPMGQGGKTGAVTPMEENVDRPGNDYSQSVKDDAETCQAECLADGKCVAWTWVRPGVQGPDAQCYLKDRVPPARPGDCCTSGVK